MSHLVWARHDDWEGLYLDGKLVEEQHTISPRAVFEACVGCAVESWEERWVDPDWISSEGRLPLSEEDVKWLG